MVPKDIQTSRRSAVSDAALNAAKGILDAIEKDGAKALINIATRFGDLKPGEPYVLGRDKMEAAFKSLPTDQQEVLQRSALRIRRFALAQLGTIKKSMSIGIEVGSAGQDVSPMERAGCYAPGGRYPLPSTVLMTCIPARVAGCSDVWLATPHPSPIMLGAAFIAGADHVLAVGGAQAIAALAHGAGQVPPVDVIVGPGNQYVTAAKQLVSGLVKIDMLAGPSELLIVADESADPAMVAADLLGQAEHDTEARPVLAAVDADGLVEKVEAELEKQVSLLATGETAR